MLAAGGVITYVQAQHPTELVSDLTLANIEALAVSEEDGVSSCCAPWKNHCGTVHMENGLI